MLVHRKHWYRSAGEADVLPAFENGGMNRFPKQSQAELGFSDRLRRFDRCDVIVGLLAAQSICWAFEDIATALACPLRFGYGEALIDSRFIKLPAAAVIYSCLAGEKVLCSAKALSAVRTRG